MYCLEINLIEQNVPTPEVTISDDAVIQYGYGFANKRYGVFTHLQVCIDIIDVIK